MATLQVQDLRLAFGDRDILDGVSFILTDQSRAALCGSNGSGKSTLLKALCGIIQPDHLDMSRTKGLTTVYLPQSEIVMPEGTVYDEVEKGYARFRSLLDEKEKIGNRLAHLTEGEKSAGLANQMQELEEELLSSGYYSRKQKILIEIGIYLACELSHHHHSLDVIEISAVLKLFHVGSVITLGTHEQDLPHLLTQSHFFEDLLCALFDLGLLAC